MTSWHTAPRAAFDLETTGRDPLTARIVTATVILVDGAGRVVEHHEWLADPGVEIPEGAAAIHGITTVHARSHGSEAGAVVAGIAAVLSRLFAAGIPVLAYNARYDFTVLRQEGRRHGIAVPVPSPVIDPFIMDKQADRYRRGKRTLTALCDHYGVRLEHAHTSAADVLATLEVGSILADRFSFLQRPARELHAALVVWADRQAANFEEYLRRTEPDAVIERAWPVVHHEVDALQPAEGTNPVAPLEREGCTTGTAPGTPAASGVPRASRADVVRAGVGSKAMSAAAGPGLTSADVEPRLPGAQGTGTTTEQVPVPRIAAVA